MKTLITISLVILGYFGYSQTPNQIVANFAKQNEGKTVGNGVCFDLINAALSQIDSNWIQGSVWSELKNEGLSYGEEVNFIKRGTGSDSVLGIQAEVKFEKLMEGDIILFENRVEEGVKADSHIGIIVADEEGNMMIAHQNVIENGVLVKSVVIEDISGYFYEKDGSSTQTIKVFRPKSKYNTAFSKVLSKKYKLEIEDGQVFLVW